MERSYSESPRTTRNAELCEGRREILARMSASMRYPFPVGSIVDERGRRSGRHHFRRRPIMKIPGDRIILAYRGHGYRLTRTSTTSSTGRGERPNRQINDHRARALCHPGPPASSRRLSRSVERTDGGVSPAIRPARSGQIVEVDVERGGDLLQRVDRASTLAVLNLRQGSRHRRRRTGAANGRDARARLGRGSLGRSAGRSR